MSYTNSTPNLHLPQYIATDKPTYLGDWNASMQTIDTVITETQATANGANSTATSANSVAQAAQTSANNANSKADNNKISIQEINSKLTFKTVKPTNLAPAAASAYSQCCYNKIPLVNLSINYSFQNSNKPNGTLVGSQYFCPLYSVPGNIFNIEAGTATDSDKHLVAFGIPYEINGENVSGGTVRIWFDGSNTIVAIQISKTRYASLTSLVIMQNLTISNLLTDSTSAP